MGTDYPFNCSRCGQPVSRTDMWCPCPAIVSRVSTCDCSAKDAEIAKLRAERDATFTLVKEVYDAVCIPLAWAQYGPTTDGALSVCLSGVREIYRQLDQARRDRNSAVECAEVLRGYVAEGKAEIAKLGAERAIHLASIAEHSKQLAAARAALDGERGRADSYRESHKPTSGCVDRIYAGGVLGPIQIDNRCGLCKAHDKLRAAETKCDGCDSTRARCDGAKAGGAIKCCPECGHGAAEAKASRGGEGKP